MKVCVIQPHYSFDAWDLQACFAELLTLMDQCDSSMDLIVLPEYSDVPADVSGKDGYYGAVAAYSPILLEKAKETARRCHALLFVNAGYQAAQGIRNTTHVIDREGNVVGRYFKAHPAPSEVKTDAEGGHGLDVDYSYDFREPYTPELEGIRFAFLTCYDFYFYESFASIARRNVDVIIGCSLQRTDTHEALSIINRFLCYNTNAYLIRASVSLGADSPTCGCSTVVSPSGSTLLNMKNEVGLGVCEIDPQIKYYKPAGHMGMPAAHYEYIEEGRRPWLYRNGGASVIPFDGVMRYPRLCACGGFHAAAPAGSMPALGAAVALDAEEIACSLLTPRNGAWVCCAPHATRDLGTLTSAELSESELRTAYGEAFSELRLPTLEQILQKFAGRVILNLHVLTWDTGVDSAVIDRILALLRKYDCERHVYFITQSDEVIRAVKEHAPSLKFCLAQSQNEGSVALVDRAIASDADKVQLCKSELDPEAIRKAHANGIRCNLDRADTTEEAVAYLKMGVDTLLTNDLLTVQNAVKAYRNGDRSKA